MKLLFFSPYAFINVWAYPEAIVANNFRQRGHDVIQVRCKGVYADYCTSMASVNLTPRSPKAERKAICKKCNARRSLLENEFGFRTLYLEDYCTRAIIDMADKTAGSMHPDTWADFEFKGIPIARYASYEYILNEKVNTLRFSPKQWNGLVTHVKNAIITAEAGQKILDEVKPDAILGYNNLYGCNHVMCALADQRSIPHYTENLGRHHRRQLSQMSIFQGLLDYALVGRSSAWQKLRDRPISEDDIAIAFEHVSELTDATSPWVYSTKSENRPPDALRDYFGVAEGQKVLLVTMSSGDERFAADLVGARPKFEVPIFPTQFAWIDALIDWAKNRTDVFLLIRVHPREFPNKREQVTSAQSKLIKEKFVELPPNCRVNWPEDSISLHDLAKITDLCLNGTSTAGLEMLLFGIPVVIYDPLQFYAYPSELNVSCDSVEDYWRKIDEALAQGRSAQNVIRAFRWIAFLSTIMSVDIGDVYGRHFAKLHPPEERRRKRTILSRLRRMPFFSQQKGKPAPDDPFMNFDGLSELKNGHWLAYAVENGLTGHLDARADERLSSSPEDAGVEYAAIAAAAERYFGTIGISPDIFARK